MRSCVLINGAEVLGPSSPNFEALRNLSITSSGSPVHQVMRGKDSTVPEVLWTRKLFEISTVKTIHNNY